MSKTKQILSQEDQQEEIVDNSELEDEEVSASIRYSVSSYGADYPVDSLVKRLLSKDIIIPEFQRGFVWSTAQAARFIESLLIGLPVPGIFLSKNSETQKLIVIDGQQRLMSLRYFYDGIIAGREFSLKGITTAELEGKTYKSLTDEDRRRLDDAIIHATIVRQEKPENDHSSIYIIFERLNTSGTPLSSQEIRNCVYLGEFNNLLRELNSNKHWRDIYGPASNRAKDQEQILRFFALYSDVEKYKRPMKVFLSTFMGENRHIKENQKHKLEQLFCKTVEVASKYLGTKVFRPDDRLNVSLVEAILVGTAKRLETGPIKDGNAYKISIQNLVSQKDFLDKCQSGTTSPENINGRLKAVIEGLKKVN